MQLVEQETFATQRLYRLFNVTLVGDSTMSDTFTQCFKGYIDGHAFMRDLEVSLSVGFREDPTTAYQWLVKLLDHLPQDELFPFRYALGFENLLQPSKSP